MPSSAPLATLISEYTALESKNIGSSSKSQEVTKKPIIDNNIILKFFIFKEFSFLIFIKTQH